MYTTDLDDRFDKELFESIFGSFEYWATFNEPWFRKLQGEQK